MKVFDKLKEIAKLTDEDYAEGMDDQDYGYTDGYQDDGRDIYSSSETEYSSRKHAASYPSYQPERPSNLVDISASSARPNVVFKQIERFDDVASVADEINEKRIVILNLETCPNDVTRRVLDFLYGVAYANAGKIKRVAGRAYIINPSNVPLTGELLDEIENSNTGGY
jgi:cell division inhibitor SepF